MKVGLHWTLPSPTILQIICNHRFSPNSIPTALTNRGQHVGRSLSAICWLIPPASLTDRKSTRLNSSHSQISYAVFCLKKKKKHIATTRKTILLKSSDGAIPKLCVGMQEKSHPTSRNIRAAPHRFLYNRQRDPVKRLGS